jgi:predicted DNA-binding protein
MRMSGLTRRLQLLLDQNRYARLAQRAEESGQSVAAVIREAIDLKLAQDDDVARRHEAGQRLLSQPAPPGREPDWESAKDDLLDERSARLES